MCEVRPDTRVRYGSGLSGTSLHPKTIYTPAHPFLLVSLPKSTVQPAAL